MSVEEKIMGICDWIKAINFIYKKVSLNLSDPRREALMYFASSMLSDFEDELEHYRDQI